MATGEGRLSAQLLRTLGVGAKVSRMGTRDADFLAQLPLAEITKVTFYKRDEITTDLICCEVVVDGIAWTFHEELVGWNSLVEHLEKLPNFRADWLAAGFAAAIRLQRDDRIQPRLAAPHPSSQSRMVTPRE